MLTEEQLVHMTDDEFYINAKERLKALPRAVRRRKERELDKNIKAMKQFTPGQSELVEQVIVFERDRCTKECMALYTYIMDIAISAYFFESNEDITEDEVFNIQEIISNLFLESYEKYGKIINECGGNEIMAKKKFEKYEEDVRKACEELLDQKVKQSEAKKVLQDKFPMLSSAILMNAFKKCKEARKVEQEEDPEIVAAAEYIFGEDEKKSTVKAKEDKQKPQKQATEEKKEVPKVNTPVEEEKPVTEVTTVEKPKLKVVSKTIVVEGQYGKYKLDDGGLEFADLKLKDTEELKEYETRIREELESRITELEEVMAMA